VNLQNNSAIAAILVTYKKNESLKNSLNSVKAQTLCPAEVLVVDNAQSKSTHDIVISAGATYIRGDNNFGGSGGFARGITEAINKGYELFWLLDDDGMAKEDCLEVLYRVKEENDVKIVGPLSISLENSAKSSNPFIFGVKKIDSVSELQKYSLLMNKVQFFNGVLLTREVVEIVGLPDHRLFIRGDEVDFAIRCHSHFRSLLATKSLYYHPSSESEYAGARSFILSANIPNDPVKSFYQFRNRGYIVRKYRKYHLAIYDWIRYPYRFLFVDGFNLKGLNHWARVWIKGFLKNLEPYEKK
jgi:rhamnopyranosyl-N-acetylglucosaminyl-diphospho-decaprenol beta-1,3/1,4-galactofuranosyltransferase